MRAACWRLNRARHPPLSRLHVMAMTVARVSALSLLTKMQCDGETYVVGAGTARL